MGDVVELLFYWRAYPPTHLILRAVHIKSEAGSAPPRSSEDLPALPTSGENETMQGLAELVLAVPQKMPAHLVAMANYAEEVAAKMKHQHAG